MVKMILEATWRDHFSNKFSAERILYIVLFVIKVANDSTWRHLASWIFPKSDSWRIFWSDPYCAGWNGTWFARKAIWLQLERWFSLVALPPGLSAPGSFRTAMGESQLCKKLSLFPFPLFSWRTKKYVWNFLFWNNFVSCKFVVYLY